MTKLKLINYLLQILFIRITRCTELRITGFQLTDVSILSGGNMGIGGRAVASEEWTWYSVQYWIVPLTGWNSEFRYIGGQQFKKLTKKARARKGEK